MLDFNQIFKLDLYEFKVPPELNLKHYDYLKAELKKNPNFLYSYLPSSFIDEYAMTILLGIVNIQLIVLFAIFAQKFSSIYFIGVGLSIILFIFFIVKFISSVYYWRIASRKSRHYISYLSYALSASETYDEFYDLMYMNSDSPAVSN